MGVSVFLVMVPERVLDYKDFPKPIKHYIKDSFDKTTLDGNTIYYLCDYELQVFKDVELGNDDIVMIMEYIIKHDKYYKAPKTDRHWDYVMELVDQYEECSYEHILTYLTGKKYIFHDIVADY